MNGHLSVFSYKDPYKVENTTLNTVEMNVVERTEDSLMANRQFDSSHCCFSGFACIEIKKEKDFYSLTNCNTDESLRLIYKKGLYHILPGSFTKPE